MGKFEAKVSALPCKYLGLTLKIGRLTRADEQTLIEKVAGNTTMENIIC
jgi:hypothetical protein